jgi:ATP-dependent exoDNAse (exonuclease V) beta subunit
VTRLTQIKASAGSGKTFALTERFLCLLAQSDDKGRAGSVCLSPSGACGGLNDILAVTFTNAAAQEMRERILRRLKLAALGLSSEAVSRPAARIWVDRIVRDLSAFNIRTIDSLVHLIVRAAALDLNLPPEFIPVFSSEEVLAPYLDILIERAARGDKPMRDLLRAACKAVAQQSASGGFLAGEKLLRRLRDIFDAALCEEYENLSPVKEIARRCQDLRAEIGFAARSLLDLAEKHDLPWRLQAQAAVAKLAEGETDCSSKYLDKENVEELFRKETEPPTLVFLAFSSLKAGLEAWKQDGQTLEDALKIYPFVKLARALALAFRANLEIEGNLPALLVPALARKALQGENGVPDVLCRLGSRLRHFLLDEFQDTSREQWQTLRPLIEEALSRGGTLTFVGDAKQSIYGWRGGEPELFEAVPADPVLNRLAPDIERGILPFNRRSRREITAHNNAFFASLQDMETAYSVMRALLPRDTPQNILRDCADKTRRIFDGCTQQIPGDKNGGFVRVETLEADRTEGLVEAVLSRLVHLLRTDVLQRRNPAEVLVLTRSNHQSAAVAERLAQAGLPVVTENSLLLASHPLVVQTVALLSFLDDPADDIAFWTLLTGSIVREHPRVGLTWEEAHNFERAPGPLYKDFALRHPALWEAVFAPFYAQSGLLSPYDLVREWFVRLEVEARFPEAGIFLRRFLEVLYRAEENGIGDTASFLSHWQKTGGDEKVPMPESMEAVRVMTIHKSKGLEAPVVILPWTDFNVKSDARPLLQQRAGLRLAAPARKHSGELYYLRYARQARENLHLLYVALTRAEEELHLFRSVAKSQGSMPSLVKGMDVLWQAAGFSPPYTCGDIPPKTRQDAGDRRRQPEMPFRFAEILAEEWRPMGWLPRLKIFRTSLEKLVP